MPEPCQTFTLVFLFSIMTNVNSDHYKSLLCWSNFVSSNQEMSILSFLYQVCALGLSFDHGHTLPSNKLGIFYLWTINISVIIMALKDLFVFWACSFFQYEGVRIVLFKKTMYCRPFIGSGINWGSLNIKTNKLEEHV